MNQRIRGGIERFYWSFMLRTSSVATTHGVKFIYITAADDLPAARILAALEDALDRIRSAKGGFGELVSHLRFVAAIDVEPGHVLVHARGYATSFAANEANHSHYLACRLIWAATYLRLSRDAMAHNARHDVERIARTSQEAQVRFTRQFPDAGEWLSFLEGHPSGI